MNAQKLLLSIFALFCISFLKPCTTYANHAAGGEIIYTHLGDSTYQFILKFYRDCGGPAAPASFNLCVYNTCTNTSSIVPMTAWSGTLPPDGRPNGSTVSPGCSNERTTCDLPRGNIPGYEEYWYSCIITDLPLQCNYWKFGCLVGNTSLCCRNQTVNLQGTTNFYIETTFNSTVYSKDKNGDLVSPWENSSPYYSVKPIPYVCINVPYSYNNGAIDPDGDSLQSQMVNPLNATNCSGTATLAPLNTNLNPPINFTNNPFPTNGTFNLVGGSGQMSFTANQAGASALSIKTREYRKDTNNVVREIGSIMRDVNVRVLTCTTIVPKLDTISIGTAGKFQNGIAYGCMNEKLEFCFEVTSTDPFAVLLLQDNLAQAIPDAKITYTQVGTDTVIGCFEWTPTQNDVGPQSFVVVVKDSTCKPPGILFQYAHTLNLHIWGPIEVTPDTSICSGESAFLGVKGGGNYQWNVISGSDPSLSSTLIPNPVATPTETTIYRVTSTINDYCPDLNKDTVKITVIEGPEILGQKDDTTCPGYGLAMDIGLTKEPNAVYTISWSPTTGLNNPTIENPTATLKTDITYTVTVSSDIHKCKTYDNITIDVLDGMNIENNDTAICFGETVSVTGSGDPRYTYKWESTDPNAIITNAGEIGTNIQPSRIGEHKYTLHATYHKCNGIDSTTDFKIDLQPIPQVTLNENATICYGDTMQLMAVVDPPNYAPYYYNWTPGAALDFPDRNNPIFSAVTVGANEISVIVSTGAGCSDTEKLTLDVYEPDFITMPADTSICPNDTVKISMLVDDNVSFYWTPDFNISSTTSMQPKVWPVTKQAYRVYAIDPVGCRDTADVLIDVLPKPIIELPNEVRIYYGEKYRMDPGGNCLYYSWFPPLGLDNADVSNPSVSPIVDTRYIVHGRTETGCTITDSINVTVLGGAIVKLPNAFNPRNGSRLTIIKRGSVSLMEYAIYNRWGMKVFETKDIDEGWDGTFNGKKQPVGVYIYTIKAITTSGENVNEQGNVTLLR